MNEQYNPSVNDFPPEEKGGSHKAMVGLIIIVLAVIAGIVIMMKYWPVKSSQDSNSAIQPLTPEEEQRILDSLKGSAAPPLTAAEEQKILNSLKGPPSEPLTPQEEQRILDSLRGS